jgi:hypothetical protein
MGLANAVKGSLRPSQSITWTREGLNTPEPLTGATLTGQLRNSDTQVTRAIAGTLTVTDGANGVFTWAYDAADVAEAGLFDVQFTAAFGTSPTPARTVVGKWTVEEAL